ncbi:MAG: aldo/keto reductase [Candidatus Krumholzibacteria bacterium]|nr:aldo/keto reductase [Candidatus Krumholzibacteria bacterium]
MKRRILGRTDIEAAAVGFGGIPIQGLTAGEAERVLLHAADCGIDFFDSARGYTDSEEKIGRALAARRDTIFLSSKALSRDSDGMRKEIETSLRNLRTGMIDLYQCHSVDSIDQLERILGPGGAWEALAVAREEGFVRWIGLTSHSREVTAAALRTGRFDTIQVPFNAIETEWGQAVLPAAHDARIGTIGMKPLAGGALSSGEAALRFALAGGIDIAIPGMDAIEQVTENIRAGDLAGPTDEHTALLDGEREAWGGLFCRRCRYCLPCPEGLNIPFLLLLEGYHSRYGLTEWAVARLSTQEKRFSACTACGACLERCPYHLPIPDLMKRAARLLEHD